MSVKNRLFGKHGKATTKYLIFKPAFQLVQYSNLMCINLINLRTFLLNDI